MVRVWVHACPSLVKKVRVDMSKARPDEEDYETETAHPMSDDDPATPSRRSSRRQSRESSLEREPGSSSGGGATPWQSPVAPGSSRTMRAGAKRQKSGELDPKPFVEAFDAIGLAGLEAAPSDSAAVHLLIAFRTHVDALKTFGVFDDADNKHLDDELAELGLGVNTEGLYELVSGFINAHIAYERAKEAPVDMDDYMKQATAPKARPYALFDVETMIPTAKPDEKQRLTELLKKQDELELEVVIATGFAEVSVLDKAVDAAETEAEFLSAVPFALKAHSKLLAPFHAASLENIQELANTVLRANPVDAATGSFDFNTVYDRRFNALVGHRRTTRRTLANLPEFTLASIPSSLPGLASSNGAVSPDTSDWRSLFPSCTTGAPSRQDRQEEFQRLQRLYGGVGQDNIPVYRQALDVMPDDILADTNVNSGQAFKRSLVSVLKYAAAWANNHKLQALVYLAPYLALGLGFGGATTLTTVAVVDLFRLAKRKVDQAGGWQEVQRLRQGFTSLSRPVRSIAGLLGGVGFGTAVTYVIDSPLVSQVYNEWTMLNSALMRAANMDTPIPWFQTISESLGGVSDANVNATAIVNQVKQWRIKFKDNDYSHAQRNSGTFYRGPAEGMASYVAEWGKTGRNIRDATDVVWKFLRTFPALGALPVLATREIINLVCIHHLEIRPDRARVYLYEADPENDDYAKTLDQLKTALSAAKIQFEYDRGNQPCAADWVPQNPPAGANLPDWYKTVHALTKAPLPAAQVVPKLKDWAEHTKAMFDKAEEKWTAEYDRSWTGDSTSRLRRRSITAVRWCSSSKGRRIYGKSWSSRPPLLFQTTSSSG